jgi:hypothetical protein
MNITKLPIRNLARTNLDTYTAIILPNLRTKLDENVVNKLKSWVRAGGTLIGYKNSANWLSANKFINLEFVTPKVEAKNITFEQR